MSQADHMYTCMGNSKFAYVYYISMANSLQIFLICVAFLKFSKIKDYVAQREKWLKIKPLILYGENLLY